MTGLFARLLAWFAPSALATAAAVGAALLAALGAQTWRLHSMQADLAKAKTVIAETRSVFAVEKQAALALAFREIEANRFEEQRRSAAQKEISDESIRLAARARADAAGAAGAGRRVQQRFAAAVVASCPAAVNPSAAAERPPAADPGAVLHGVFRRTVEAAGELAAAADASRIAGDACIRAYESLTPTTIALPRMRLGEP